MKNFINDNWEMFNKNVEGKDVYLFGYNGALNIIAKLQMFNYPWNVVAIMDNDKVKQGETRVCNREYKVLAPEYLSTIKDKSKIVVLICGTYTKEMSRQLDKLQIENYYSEFWMSRSEKLKNIYPQEIDNRSADLVKSYLADNESKNIYNKIIEKRLSGDIDYTDIMYRGMSEYFISEYWEPFLDGVYIDGGAYDGDTIEEIVRWTKGDFKQIYSFEPQANLFKSIDENIKCKYGERLKLFNRGLWSSETRLSFADGDDIVSGSITDSPSKSIITTCKIDDVVDEKVSFIKMDIEGAEIEALKGAEKTIKRDRPCMAVCIYHKQADLWEIPMLIHSMVPEYKFYLKHCGVSIFGTILYAKI